MEVKSNECFFWYKALQVRVRCGSWAFCSSFSGSPNQAEGMGEGWRWIMSPLISSQHTWGWGGPEVPRVHIAWHSLRWHELSPEMHRLWPRFAIIGTIQSIILHSAEPSFPRGELSATWSQPAGSSQNQWLVFFHLEPYFFLCSWKLWALENLGDDSGVEPRHWS